MNKKVIIGAAVLILGAAVFALTQMETIDPALYENAPTYEIEIKDHKFSPDRLTAKVGEPFKLIVHNRDKTPEEFESDDLRREKIIPGGSSATIFLPALEAGEYHFYGEFNLDTANGYLAVQ